MIRARTVVASLSLWLMTGCPKDQPGNDDDADDSGASSPGSDPTEAGSSPCIAACLHLSECENEVLAPSMSACISLCESSALQDTEWCRTAAVDWYTCLTTAPCEDTLPGPQGSCAVAFADYGVSCTPCAASIEPDDCRATADCTGGFAVSFACVDDTCTCDLDGEQFASCPAAASCGDAAQIQAAAEACCEMPFTPAVPLE